MAKVNLDALIPREDFEVGGANNSGNLKQTLSVSDFSTTGFFYPFIRKPDFQRETSEWDEKKIGDFIESYINGDLIPSVILWRNSGGLFFVIDGAHRLSALISWINDDYGDGEISQKFYDSNISDEQKIIAENTRRFINKKIGSYKDITETANISNPNPNLLIKAKNLAGFSVQVQWVDGDASKAEDSFFKINQQGEPLNTTEIKLLKSRKKGNAIAARAIIRGGRGHKYWATFTAENQNKIQEISDEINKIFFSPPLMTPLKTLDLPIAGKITSAQTLSLIFDFVNIVNQIPSDYETKINDDTNGEETLRYLQKVRKVAWRINSIHASSLGLHPIVYFYSADGRHKTASFYAITAWILETESKINSFRDFVKVRPQFEMLLLKFDYLIQDINRKHRQAIRSFQYIKDFYTECISQLIIGKNIDETISEVIKTKKFNYLKIDNLQNQEITKSEFTTEKKSAIFIK